MTGSTVNIWISKNLVKIKRMLKEKGKNKRYLLRELSKILCKDYKKIEES
jgi:hypothetical protein